MAITGPRLKVARINLLWDRLINFGGDSFVLSSRSTNPQLGYCKWRNASGDKLTVN